MNLITLFCKITPVNGDGDKMEDIYINPNNISEILPVADMSYNAKITHSCLLMNSGNRHMVEGEPARVIVELDSKAREKTQAFGP